MKIRNVLNFARSANAPVIRAGVMIANIAWKIMNNSCGIPVPSRGSAPTPFSPKNSVGSPIKPPWLGAKARLYPTTTQRTPTRPITMKLCMMVPIAFLLRVNPA